MVVTDLTTSSLGLARITRAGARTHLAAAAYARSPAVSPHGDRIAYVSTDEQAVDHLWLGPVGGGTPTEIDSNAVSFYDRPAWAPDAMTMAVDQYGPVGSQFVTIWQAAVGDQPAGAKDVRAAAGYDVLGLTWRREDVAAPVVTFPGAAKWSSTSVRVPVSITDDTTPVGGLTVTCTVDGKPVGRCAGGWSGTAAVGTHKLAVAATDAHGHRTEASFTWIVDTTRPVVHTTALPAFILTSPGAFAYSATARSGIASFDVRYRRAGWSSTSFGAYTYPASWQRTTARSRTLSMSPGSEYCLSVRARDAIGNLSAWSAERCTAMPLDDRSLAWTSGPWRDKSSSSAYRKTLTQTLGVKGATLGRSGVRVRRVAIIATTCPTCGSVDVFLGATRIGSLSLVSSATRARQVLLVPLRATVSRGTLSIRTRSDRRVVIDGLGLRRT